MSQVRKAIEILQNAVSNLPIGSPMHESVINSVKTLSKHFPASGTDQGMQQTALTDLVKDQQQQAAMAQLSRAMQAKQAMGSGGAPQPPTAPMST